MRTRSLATGALLIALGVFAVVAARTAADPITLITGNYRAVAPTGTGIHDLVFTRGYWGYLPAPPENMTLSDMPVKSAGAFPLIDITGANGAAKITIMDALDPMQMAVFDLSPGSRTWMPNGSAGFLVPAVLESNTIRGADLSLFARGGILEFSTTGVMIDQATNTATVSDMATGSFSLQAFVPEPSAALLAVIGGSVGLLWLWRTRQRRVAA